jgi:hypothetical protein
VRAEHRAAPVERSGEEISEMSNAGVWRASLAGLLVMGVLASCAGGEQSPATAGVGGDAAGAEAGRGATAASGASGPVMIDVEGDAAGGAGESCQPVTCTPEGGNYCGKIGDGCGNRLDCGECDTDWICDEGLCVGGPDCEPLSCEAAGGGQYCGALGDGCGHALDCGDCPTGDKCDGGLCVPEDCSPAGCNPESASYCGTIGNGCGRSIDCGDCEAPAECGLSGISGVCAKGLADCTPLTCDPAAGGHYCGTIGDGCGGVLECPDACPTGKCGDETAGVCPGTVTGGCTNLQCNVDVCDAGKKTSITGVVFDPAGVVPLYNVLVYVPNAAPDALSTGASCGRCDAPVSGQPIATALTNASGRFTLENVPSGLKIPLVIQVGKWRREITMPKVLPCQENIFSDKNLLRLPKKKSEGHLPQLAVGTGFGDSLECLLRRIGIDDSEFTNPDGGGRVHLYAGADYVVNTTHNAATKSYVGGPDFPPRSDLTASLSSLQKYDAVLLSCEGDPARDVTTVEKKALKDYADIGGRAFLEHYHSAYLRGVTMGEAPNDVAGEAAYTATPFPPIASSWVAGSSFIAGTFSVDKSFPKGAAFATWLANVAASTVQGQIDLSRVKNPAAGLVPATAQQWLYSATNVPYFSFNTPVDAPADQQCGRVVHTGIHVANLVDSIGSPFPDSCQSTPLSAQEKALEFMLFDLSSCVQLETAQPLPPLPAPPGVPVPPPAVAAPPPPSPPVPPVAPPARPPR